MTRFLFLVLLIPTLSFGQTTKQDSIWKPVKFFEGEWKGTGEGEPGKGTYERKFQFVMNRKFLQIDNTTSYPPTDKNPKGELHEDKGMLSYDKTRKRFILRQFHIEGFVNTYVLDSISPDGNTMIFITEQIENIPQGWKAKETWKKIDEKSFVEIFELSEPGKDFQIYSTATFTRK